MTKRYYTLGLLAGFLLLPLLGHSQAQKGDLMVSVHSRPIVGWGGNFGLLSNGQLGTKLGYMATDHLEIGLQSKGQLQANGSLPLQYRLSTGVYATHYFGHRRLQPFLSGGISGVAGNLPYQVNTQSGDLYGTENYLSVNYNLSAGLQYRLVKNLHVFGEWQYSKPILSTPITQSPVKPQRWQPATFGIRWRLGGR